MYKTKVADQILQPKNEKDENSIPYKIGLRLWQTKAFNECKDVKNEQSRHKSIPGHSEAQQIAPL